MATPIRHDDRAIPSEVVEELVNALQVALLLSEEFLGQLERSRWAEPAGQLRAALGRAAKAAVRLREWSTRSDSGA